MNPLNFNPIKDLLAEAIDFERVRRQRPVKLFISATDVQTAKVKIFTGKELGVAHVLASTCLPMMMQAVEVDGEYYWDGSYAGNPAIFPLIYECEARDILMVHITPVDRPGVPTTVARDHESHAGDQLQHRVDPEMRTIAYLNRLIEDGKIGDGGKRMLVHLIEAEDMCGRFHGRAAERRLGVPDASPRHGRRARRSSGWRPISIRSESIRPSISMRNSFERDSRLLHRFARLTTSHPDEWAFRDG